MQQREINYVAALRKVPDFNSLVISINTGAFNAFASVIGSQMTTDFRTEHDKRLAEGKLMAFKAWIMAKWFATVHDDTVAAWHKDDVNDDNPDRDAAYHTVDEARMELFKKLWMLFEEVTTKIHPTNSEEDRIARKCIGNNVDITLKKHVVGRNRPLSSYAIGDPDYNAPPPTRDDFIKFRPKKNQHVRTCHGIDERRHRRSIATRGKNTDIQQPRDDRRPAVKPFRR